MIANTVQSSTISPYHLKVPRIGISLCAIHRCRKDPCDGAAFGAEDWAASIVSFLMASVPVLEVRFLLFCVIPCWRRMECFVNKQEGVFMVVEYLAADDDENAMSPLGVTESSLVENMIL